MAAIAIIVDRGHVRADPRRLHPACGLASRSTWTEAVDVIYRRTRLAERLAAKNCSMAR